MSQLMPLPDVQQTQTRLAKLGEDLADNQRVIKSYVWHKDQCFFVSTIERESSSPYAQQRYNETLVWRYDWKTAERGDLVSEHADTVGSISNHLAICAAIFKDGVA